MKIGAVVPAYNDEAIISGTIKSLKPFVDKFIVLISEKPYFGEYEPPDKTEEICNELGVEVIKGVWPLDHVQRNLGISLCQDMDWILTFDSDEMMTYEQMEKFLGHLKEVKAPAVANRPEIYWNSTDYVLRPIPDFTPIIAVRPHVRFVHIRNIDHVYALYNDPMHHLSWCKPKDIRKKVMCYAHAPEYDWDTWYKGYYDKWNFVWDKSVKFPSGDSYIAIKQPLPDELLNHLKKEIQHA